MLSTAEPTVPLSNPLPHWRLPLPNSMRQAGAPLLTHFDAVWCRAAVLIEPTARPGSESSLYRKVFRVQSHVLKLLKMSLLAGAASFDTELCV